MTNCERNWLQMIDEIYFSYNMNITILYMYSRMSSCDYTYNYTCDYNANQ